MSASHVKVIAEIHGFSDPDAGPVAWSVGLERVAAAEGDAVSQTTWCFEG